MQPMGSPAAGFGARCVGGACLCTKVLVLALDACSFSTLLDAHLTERKFVFGVSPGEVSAPSRWVFLGFGHSLDMKLGQQTR